MRSFLFSLFLWIGLSTIAGTFSGAFMYALTEKLWFAVVCGILGTIVCAILQMVLWNQHLDKQNKAHEVALAKQMTEAMKAEAEIAAAQEREESTKPALFCPHCMAEHRKNLQPLKVPYDFTSPRNVFTCPQCKNDFGVMIHVQTYQAAKEVDAE